MDWKLATQIRNVPIPLVYWPSAYKYWKGNQWKGVKKLWFQWKIIVLAMTRTTVDDFWGCYSVPDKSGTLWRMKYTPLLKQLQSERKAENERLTELARAELTPEKLTYRKGGERFVMIKPSMIAALYRRLKGLEVDELEDVDDREDED
ncbi:hypothetical protein B0H14DRAFT_3525313 [Mycena olivaceomarginata]|nr:hypothetical protein B0H14DRAFT_3525313 [Mycena olivaceomarginata]